MMGEAYLNKSLEPTFKAKPCPICNRKSVETSHPFCSTRCADVDLQRWFSGSYVIPTEELAHGLSSEFAGQRVPSHLTDEA